MYFELIMGGPFIWLFGIFLALLLPYIKFIHHCTKELKEIREIEIDNLNLDDNIKSTIYQIFNIHRKYNRRDSYITYSFWSFIGIIASSAFGVLCQYFDLDQLYAIVTILLFGGIFSTNFITIAWYHVKNG